ncbi:MAG TPA: MBOAT family O-acyltransferase [Vicinamibacterales bacterium]|nr:MBOAT family O-acyltransferase [Vicinamibacterales bacterium]
MILTDLRFLVLFAGCWLMFIVVPRARRAHVLAAWGAVFYALYAGMFIVLIVVLTAAVLLARRRWQAWLAGVAIVASLAAFKIVEAEWLPRFTGPAAVLIPLGLSYLSFELLHVVIERRRGRLGDVSAANLLAFVFFAPCRVAGPIRRYPEFVAEIERAAPSADDFYRGLLRVLVGLAKKFVVADTLSLTVAELEAVRTQSHAWIVVLAYGFQLLFDFSAYSDLAIGFSRMLGIRVPENFNYPYLAVNIRDFWNRWHISLSHWVRDYVFVPMGRRLFATGLRPYPAVIAAVSYLVTFLIVGAWHGLTATFLLWGLYHGVLLSVHHVIQAHLPLAVAGSRWYRSPLGSTVAWAITFVCVTVGWVPFMTDLDRAQQLLRLMAGAAQ